MDTKYTFDENCVSDLHKDAYGFRPGQNWWDTWNSNTDAEKQAEWDYLIEAMEASVARDQEREDRAVIDFEKMVALTIENGAKDRETAFRWIMEASDSQGDWDYLAWNLGIPYGYFKKVA